MSIYSPDLRDTTVAAQPGQQSAYELLANYYRGALALAYADLDKLPGLYDERLISAITYRHTDRCLCEIIDTYRTLLALLGQPQPLRSR